MMPGSRKCPHSRKRTKFFSSLLNSSRKKQTEGEGGFTITFCGWSSFDGRGREEGWRQYLNIDIAQDLADASDEIEDVESANGTDSLESGLMKRRRIWNSFPTYCHTHIQMLVVHIPFNLMLFEYLFYSLKLCKSAPRSDYSPRNQVCLHCYYKPKIA